MKTTEERVNYACNVIRRGMNHSRKFNSCLEGADADAVCRNIVERASNRGGKLLENLSKYIAPSSIEAYSGKL